MIIDQLWPEQDIELISACPICESKKSQKLYSGVKDWSFNCAPGDWSYWQCGDCQSLYLNPRPTIDSIGRAYGSYYTHQVESENKGVFGMLRIKLRNECYFHWLGIDVQPRLNFESDFLFHIFRPFIPRRFPLDELHKNTRGELLDVGCGNGDLLSILKVMGFKVSGLEIDHVAVATAQERGLAVRQGSFDLLCEYSNHFDYIVCSHVLEHVHEPRKMIQLLIDAVKPGGLVFITWPNPDSIALQLFGKYWRGLEAPRHLCLLSEHGFLESVRKQSTAEVLDVCFYGSGVHTVGESWKIRRGSIGIAMKIVNKLTLLLTSMLRMKHHHDFVTVSFKKSPMNSAE